MILSIKCPIDFSGEEMREITSQYNQEQERMTGLEEMREVIGIDALGWVPDDEQLEGSKAIAQKIKEGFIVHSTTEEEQISVRKHFPFDDHDEDSGRVYSIPALDYFELEQYILLNGLRNTRLEKQYLVAIALEQISF
ncbi:conserved hypothetical protein [Paecilomyces variotii No. 5]|uniref:Uncharacterized protein n=1 Tax=Byssochlamys spectabilis (strain No. 5 / NBRC 109023) TaxID=1356009 RepID=V5HRF3_BYSSN|nr:conserved hypothetical protein [Paecilomyces variotii No. 5]